MIKNYGLKPKIKPACHITLLDGREFLVAETNRTINADGRYKIDYNFYEIHNGIADTLLGKGNNPIILEEKYTKKK